MFLSFVRTLSAEPTEIFLMTVDVGMKLWTLLYTTVHQVVNYKIGQIKYVMIFVSELVPDSCSSVLYYKCTQYIREYEYFLNKTKYSMALKV